MTPKKKDSPILGQAMLVNVWIGLWAARKHDKKVTDKINQEMAHDDKAGRYHKRLFGGAGSSHSAVIASAVTARTTHHKQTLPWEDTGWRLLPTANYFEYTGAMRQAKVQFEEKLEVFLADYSNLIELAQKSLGTMFKRDDYPPVTQIRHKFHFQIEFSPIPFSDDLRLSLPQAELKIIKKEIEERVARTTALAIDDAWTRLGDTIIQLRTRLDDGKNLRDTMIARVTEVADILGRLNVTNDPKLERVRQQTLNDLTGLDAEVLKDHDELRSEAAKKADAILAAMQDVYKPSKDVAEKAAPILKGLKQKK